MFPTNAKQAYGPMVLIARFFDLKTSDFKSVGVAAGLTDLDKVQLGSAIARQNNIPQENLKFQMVEY